MEMTFREFDFDDVLVSHDALREVPDSPAWRERLWARVERGPAPTCAAARLAELGDRRVETLLVGLAAYLDPPDIPALIVLRAADALAAALAAPWVPRPIRTASADALTHLAPTPAALCALAEVGDQESRSPLRTHALAAYDALAPLADEPTKLAADHLRARVKLVRSWTGVRRQELQREVATGLLHPVVGLLGGDPTFLATLVPPIVDAARASLVPCLLANARADEPNARSKTFALFHSARWRDVAREPLSALARFVKFRGRDESLPELAVAALAAMGATREVLYAVVSGSPSARDAALGVLERIGTRVVAEVGHELLEAGAERLERKGDAGAAKRLRALLPPR